MFREFPGGPVVRRLGLGAFTARAQVQSLVGELRSCRQQGATK